MFDALHLDHADHCVEYRWCTTRVTLQCCKWHLDQEIQVEETLWRIKVRRQSRVAGDSEEKGKHGRRRTPKSFGIFLILCCSFHASSCSLLNCCTVLGRRSDGEFRLQRLLGGFNEYRGRKAIIWKGSDHRVSFFSTSSWDTAWVAATEAASLAATAFSAIRSLMPDSSTCHALFVS